MLTNEHQKHDNEGTVGPANLDFEDATTRKVIAEIHRHEWAMARQREEEARKDPLLRLCMVELVHHLNEIVADYAGLLAMKRGDDSWFNADKAAIDIMWQLNEFLGQCHIYRNDDPYDVFMALVKPHQLTRDHTADWFEVPMICVDGRKGFTPGFYPSGNTGEFNPEEKPLVWSDAS